MMALEKINVFKIKSHVADFDEFVKGGGFRQLALPELEIEAGVEVRAAFKKTGGAPKDQNAFPWLVFINTGLRDAPFTFNARNIFPAALMAVKLTVDGQTNFFALTFGLGGDSFLDREMIVRDFGIKVAMNMCDPENLRRVQTSVHEAITTQTERQVSTGAALSVFHLDNEQEFLRTLSGLAKQRYAYVASLKGKESIAIKCKKDEELSWQKLIETLVELNELSQAEDYKDIFVGYDKFVLETDKQINQELDDALFERIRAGNLEKIHMAPPEFFDFDRYTFKYQDKDDEPEFDDLQISDLLNRHRAFRETASMASIKNWGIYVQDSETGRRFRKWKAYQCIVAEQQRAGVLYILSNSCWKSVEANFKTEVTDYVTAINASDLAVLPTDVSICRVKRDGTLANREEFYNSDAVAGSAELFLFDKAKIEIAGEKRYEVCDILHRDKKFIHVKRYTSGCASISHMFVQIRFYADAFISDGECRQGMIDHVGACQHEANNNKDVAAFQRAIPASRDEIAERDYEVVVCILSTDPAFSVDHLPFMAKYELMSTHKYLTTNRGFHCGIIIRTVTVDDAGQPDEQAA